MPKRMLFTLRPGTWFRLAEMPEVTGTLLRASECRAVVRLDQPEKQVTFTADEGEVRQFRCRGSYVTSWAPTTVVEPGGFDDLEDDSMSATTKKAKKRAGKKASGQLSCIDAAAKVLGESTEPMSTKAMIEAMAAKGYWSSPSGQTPSATLYSAILREIQKKGAEARFEKADKGQFRLKGAKAAAKKGGRKKAAPEEPAVTRTTETA